MNNLIIVFVGGGLGSLARYGIARAFAQWPSVFPLGTLTANILACLILGAFGGWATFKSADLVATSRLFVVVGFCGGYTTFSSFSLQTQNLARQGDYLYAGGNVLLSVVLCLLGVWLGTVAAGVFNQIKGA